MNIENIKALAKLLHSIGVENAASGLLRRICLHPEKFMLERRIIKGADTISAQFYFQKVGDGFDYSLRHYDVILVSESQLKEQTINGVSIPALEEEMKTIDWKKAFETGSLPTD